MKRFLQAERGVLLMIAAALFVCSAFAQQTLESSGPSKMNIAALNLKNSSGVTTGESELISDRLRGDLFNTGKVNVMERDQMQEVLKEQGFQASGACTDEACLVQMGQLLGVSALVTGSLGKVGSMFMVNVRMIDVKTAKIVKVVSVDVRGEIEDVVGKLKDIADQLVSAAPEAKKPVETLNEKKEGPGITEKIGTVAGKIKDAAVSVVSSKPKDKKAEEVNNIEEKKAVDMQEDPMAERNKNRSGIRLSMNLFMGSFDEKGHWIDYSMYGSQTGDTTIALSKLFPPENHLAFINWLLLFSIRIGQLFTLDIGPGYTSGNVTYGPGTLINGNYYSYSNDVTVISFHTGFNFVKRWYPFKLNAGIELQGNYLNYAETFPVSNGFGGTIDSTAYSHGFNAAVGIRIGGEFLLGQHFGIGSDIILRHNSFETLAERYYGANGTYYDFSRIITLPVFAIGFGCNFYY